MDIPNRPTGRKRRVDTTVSGNAHKRGSGFAPGGSPFGGSSGPSGHSGSSFGSQHGSNIGGQNDPTRMSGSNMGLIALLAYLLLGRKNGNGNKQYTDIDDNDTPQSAPVSRGLVIGGSLFGAALLLMLILLIIRRKKKAEEA